MNRRLIFLMIVLNMRYTLMPKYCSKVEKYLMVRKGKEVFLVGMCYVTNILLNIH